MTSPETQLVLANMGAVRGRALAIGFGPDLETDVVFHQDVSAHRRAQGSLFGAWLPAETGQPFDTALVRMPKARERLDMNLEMAAAACAPGARIVVVGHNDAGARSAGKHLARVATDVDVLDYKFHCRAFMGTVAEAVAFDPSSWRTAWTTEIVGRELSLVSYPGVFAHGRVDAATQMLLEELSGLRIKRALDVGCGDGVIGAWLAAGGVECDGVDADAVAIAAATESGARARASNVFSDVDGLYSHIVSNPPFHAGIRTTSEVSQRLITEAPTHLAGGGELWLVANKFLDYLTPLREVFSRVEIVREDNRYRVYRARR